MDKGYFNKVIPDFFRIYSARWSLLPWCSILLFWVIRVRIITSCSTSNLVSTANYIRSRIWSCRWLRVQSVALRSTNRRTGRHIVERNIFYMYIKDNIIAVSKRAARLFWMRQSFLALQVWCKLLRNLRSR